LINILGHEGVDISGQKVTNIGSKVISIIGCQCIGSTDSRYIGSKGRYASQCGTVNAGQVLAQPFATFFFFAAPYRRSARQPGFLSRFKSQTCSHQLEESLDHDLDLEIETKGQGDMGEGTRLYNINALFSPIELFS